jgi:dTDP-4-dehydrorhamnose reductase
MKILILGATGMLGYSLFKNLSDSLKFDVYGTVRTIEGLESFYSGLEGKLFNKVNILSLSSVDSIIESLKPNVVINCIGLIKQKSSSKKYIDAIEVNSLLPHQLAEICDSYGAKLIHFSTDCVFDGGDGNYCESDNPDAMDLYGQSKQLGEVKYGPHLTFRTSIIGHELKSSISLIDWFLSSENEIDGYSKAIFSGLPTCYIAKIFEEKLHDFMTLSGLYHLSVEPIDKLSLLKKVSEVYMKNIVIKSNDSLIIDRSLDNSKLKSDIGFLPLGWDALIKLMHEDYQDKYIK